MKPGSEANKRPRKPANPAPNRTYCAVPIRSHCLPNMVLGEAESRPASLRASRSEGLAGLTGPIKTLGAAGNVLINVGDRTAGMLQQSYRMPIEEVRRCFQNVVTSSLPLQVDVNRPTCVPLQES